jgi:arylsulfatase A-like enzyme
MTGRYCWRSSLKKWVLGGFGKPIIEPERLTVAKMLQSQGYATAVIGKWHLGLDWALKGEEGEEKIAFDAPTWSLDGFDVDYAQPIGGGPNTLGFDYFFGIAGSLDMPPYCYIENDHTVGIPDREKEPYYNQQRKGMMTSDFKDEEVDITFAHKAVEFIEKHHTHNPEQPFFLYLPTASPHRPCDIRPDFVIDKSQAGDRGDMVVLFDWIVGQVLDVLDRLELADNTLLIVTSDNGARATCANGLDYGHKSNGELRGQKADIWDGGHREPFLARWPGVIPEGSTGEAPVCLVDFMATAADITGYDLPAGSAEDSFSLLPILKAEKNTGKGRAAIIHHSGDGMFSIRQGDWKLIAGLGSGGFTEPKHETPMVDGPTGQLYHLGDDLVESHNLWLERPDIVNRLMELLKEMKRDEA